MDSVAVKRAFLLFYSSTRINLGAFYWCVFLFFLFIALGPLIDCLYSVYVNACATLASHLCWFSPVITTLCLHNAIDRWSLSFCTALQSGSLSATENSLYPKALVMFPVVFINHSSVGTPASLT